MNYDKLMQEEISKIKLLEEAPTLLLHCCCAPCSSAVLERLSDYFKITVFYYNPNIELEVEYQKRINELKRFVKDYTSKYPISFIEGEYNPNIFKEFVPNREGDVEGGKSCYDCYKMRLLESALVAKENDFDYFTTTLSISPNKRANWLNEIGKGLEEEYQIKYLYADFKKQNGYKRSIYLANKYNLYRQDYCGCNYSKIERTLKKKENIVT